MRTTPTGPRRSGVYERMFARLYDPFMERAEKVVLHRRRRALIAPLRDTILEIGAGTGVNFGLYHKDTRVLAAEPAPAMRARAAAVLAAAAPGGARIELLPFGLGDPELGALIAPASVDAVVCTLVLCTVPDLAAAVDFIRSRLKRGGSLILLEHVRAHSRPGQALQFALNPFWKKFALGCHLNRDPRTAFRAAGFEPVAEDSFTMTLPFYQAVLRAPGVGPARTPGPP